MTRTRDFQGLPADCIPDGYDRLAPGAGGLRARFARSLLALCGWKLGGPPPDLDKYVIVAAPHTSWWDGVWMLMYARSWGLRIRWMGKASLSRGPLGWIPRRIGIIPIDRSEPRQMVAEVSALFAESEELLLSTPPEGTRERRDYWKSGFYRIARAANVPVCLSYLDYEAREAGFGPCFMPGRDVVADMDRIRAFYKPSWARHPALFTPPRLRDEEAAAAYEKPGAE